MSAQEELEDDEVTLGLFLMGGQGALVKEGRSAEDESSQISIGEDGAKEDKKSKPKHAQSFP
jgi:hypothetical protein